jgi:hypothetical protein
MLEVQMSKRITTAEILAYPWINEEYEAATPEPEAEKTSHGVGGVFVPMVKVAAPVDDASPGGAGRGDGRAAKDARTRMMEGFRAVSGTPQAMRAGNTSSQVREHE